MHASLISCLFVRSAYIISFVLPLSTCRLVESYARTIDGVVHGTAKMAVPFAVFAGNSKKGVEPEAVTKENQ